MGGVAEAEQLQQQLFNLGNTILTNEYIVNCSVGQERSCLPTKLLFTVEQYVSILLSVARAYDIRVRHVKCEHVFEAIKNVKDEEVEEGTVGAGTGMAAFDFKGA
jgi:hypothetical protein